MDELRYPRYFFTPSGTRIFYNTNFKEQDYCPKTPTIVLNYGLVCSIKHFQHQVSHFHQKGYQLISHDYRSHFASSNHDLNDCTFRNIVADLNGLLKSLHVSDVHMIGHSMGVNISLEYARHYHEDLRSLTLISGTILPPHDIMFDSNYVEIFMPYLNWLSKNFPNTYEKIWKSSFLNPLARKAIHSGGFNTSKVPDDFIQLYLKKISELPKEILIHLLEQMKQHDIIHFIETIQTPSLVIGGDRDKVIPNYLQFLLHKHLKNSEIYIVRNGSHVPQHDFPEYINERIDLLIHQN